MTNTATTRRTADCVVCGARCQRKPDGTWRHMRTQPDGSSHDHNARPADA